MTFNSCLLCTHHSVKWSTISLNSPLFFHLLIEKCERKQRCLISGYNQSCPNCNLFHFYTNLKVFHKLTLICKSWWWVQRKKRDGDDDTSGVKKHKKSKVTWRRTILVIAPWSFFSPMPLSVLTCLNYMQHKSSKIDEVGAKWFPA